MKNLELLSTGNIIAVHAAVVIPSPVLFQYFPVSVLYVDTYMH